MTDTTTNPPKGPVDPRPGCTVCGSTAHTAGFHDSGEPTGFHDSSMPADADDKN
jgi:hypothetical protein